VPAEHRFRLDQRGPGGPGEPARQGGEDETIGRPPADDLHLAFEDADLVAQNQQLGLISGAVAEGCEGEGDEESEAGVKRRRGAWTAADRSRSERAAAEFGWTFGTLQAISGMRPPGTYGIIWSCGGRGDGLVWRQCS
jgi:hypothetical protein